MEAFQYQRASQAAYVSLHRLAVVGTIVLRSINIQGLSGAAAGKEEEETREPQTVIAPSSVWGAQSPAGLLMPSMALHKVPAWFQVHVLPSDINAFSNQRFMQAAKLSGVEKPLLQCCFSSLDSCGGEDLSFLQLSIPVPSSPGHHFPMVLLPCLSGITWDLCHLQEPSPAMEMQFKPPLQMQSI